MPDSILSLSKKRFFYLHNLVFKNHKKRNHRTAYTKMEIGKMMVGSPNTSGSVDKMIDEFIDAQLIIPDEDTADEKYPKYRIQTKTIINILCSTEDYNKWIDFVEQEHRLIGRL